MSDQELFEALTKVIEPIHKFYLQYEAMNRELPGGVSFVNYEMPLQYIRGFSAVYVELEKRIQRDEAVTVTETITTDAHHVCASRLPEPPWIKRIAQSEDTTE